MSWPVVWKKLLRHESRVLGTGYDFSRVGECTQCNQWAMIVWLDLPTESRKKFEQLITELVHQRDVTRSMIEDRVEDINDFRWLYHLCYGEYCLMITTYPSD